MDNPNTELPYTFVTDGDSTIIKSTDNDMLNFVGIIMFYDFKMVQRELSVPTNRLSTAKDYIVMWYETLREAEERSQNAG